MSISDATENAILKLIFLAQSWAGYADNAALPDTHVAIALHTANPGDAGNQSTNEVSYTGYQRASVLRSSAGWTVVGNLVNPVNPIDFPICAGAAGALVTHFSAGKSGGGASQILWSGTVEPNILIQLSKAPRLTIQTGIALD